MQEKILIGLMGRGILQSLSPTLHETEAQQHGLRLHYQLIDFDQAEANDASLGAMVNAARVMGFAGFNVTFPFKQAVIEHLDSLSPEAAAVGAVNTVVNRDGTLIGYNTDGSGWRWGFSQSLPNADLSHVVLLGAGGAGSAVADAAIRMGVTKLSISDREPERAGALVARLNALHGSTRAEACVDVERALKTASGLIHTTPTGMSKMPGVPVPLRWLRSSQWLSEIVYFPLETELLKGARSVGCATMDGCWMTVGQAVDAFSLFTGRQPDANRMNAHLRQLIANKT
ncbi:MAG: shikimate dehydrogenase [Burkholderiales bacterium]|nr:MAG: shikimate dehydrogenase [Betaproteobacteria bacterium]TAG24777.1 MAG: shikimate dehydrogenase [Burkholderiales bacterium]